MKECLKTSTLPTFSYSCYERAMIGNCFEYYVFLGRIYKSVSGHTVGGARCKHRLRNERAGEINLPVEAAWRAAEGKAKGTRIEKLSAHNAALAC